jgi:hypothetical protein
MIGRLEIALNDRATLDREIVEARQHSLAI